MSPKTSDVDLDAPGASRFHKALARFDQANSEDLNRVWIEEGFQPKELVYAQRMTEWLDRLVPDASEPLRLAARCQHIQRWVIPRNGFPLGRDGYREWRTTLAAFHAEMAGGILDNVGYDSETIARVQALLRKDKLKADPEVQALEDVICLVFLQFYLGEFADQHDEGKLVDILRKTWRKMSERGRAVAFSLNLKPELKRLVERATS